MTAEHAVGRLIESVKEVEARRGKRLSDLELVRRALSADPGAKVSPANVARLRTEKPRSVSPKQIKLLSDMLRVSSERVIDAYLEDFGYQLNRPRVSIETAIGEDERLSADDKAVLLDVVKSLVRRRKVQVEPISNGFAHESKGSRDSNNEQQRRGPRVPSQSKQVKRVGALDDDVADVEAGL